MTRISERLELCNAQIEESPYSHTVAAGWYAEDVPALVQACEDARRLLTPAEFRGRYECVDARITWHRQHGDSSLADELERDEQKMRTK